MGAESAERLAPRFRRELAQSRYAGDMSSDPDAESFVPGSDPRRIRLARGGAILFEKHGFRLIEPRGLKRSPLHPYESLTHTCLAARALLIGTTRGLLAVRNSDFVDPENGPAAARDRLLAHLAATPDGGASLAAMARVEALTKQSRPLWSSWVIALLCIAGTGFQLRDSLIDQIGAFVPDLFTRGELWRGVTAHFLHALPSQPGLVGALIPGLRGLPIHLAINVGGLFALSSLVERPLGSWRMAILLLISGIGAIAGILIAGHVEVIGASGLVAGLAGAILALELHFPASLPCDWRIPRRVFLIAIFIQFAIVDPLFRSYLAGGAHLGGFAGGYAAAWWLGSEPFDNPAAALRLRLTVLAGLVCAGAIAWGIVPLSRHDPLSLERHGMRLLNAPAAYYLVLHENAAAWLIANEREPSEKALEIAVALADRAVGTTERLAPDVLDTLAEALFQSGDRLGAILAIDEAIELAPYERYFIEQRRRFTGERAEDDRPEPPGSGGPGGSPFWGEDEAPPFDPDAPQITI